MASGIAADLLVHVGADVKDAISGLNRVDNQVNKSGAGFGRAGLMMGGASLAIVGGLGAAVNAAADYESAISQITALGGEFASGQEAISALALDIGQKTAFSATEGALAIAELAKAGVPLQDILAGAAMEAANLAAAGGQSVPEAAVTMSNAMNMFGIAGKDAITVADSFAAAANASASDVHDLSMALAQGGPASAALGNSLQETNAVLALFSNYGIKGSDAGTSLKTMLQSLTNPSAEAAAKMQELGIAAFDANGQFVGFEALAGQLQTSLKDLTQEQRATALAMIFGSDASRVANVLYEEGAAGVAKMTAAVSEQGVAGEMAKAKMDNLNGALEQLKGSFETALIIIGSMFIPVIRKLADGITGALNKFLKLPKPVQKLGGIIAAATAGFLALGAAVGVLIAFSGPLIAGLAAITSPILILIGLVAALGLAWTSNFLGIRDVVDRVGNAIGGFLDKAQPWIYFFEEAFKSGSRIRNLIIYFPKPLQEAAKGFLLIADALGDVYRAFDTGGFGGMLESLPDALRQIGNGFKILISEGLNKLADAFTAIDWGAVGSALWSGLLSALDFIGDITGTVVGKLGDLALALGGWLWEHASKVDWIGILSGAANVAGNTIIKIANLGIDAIPKLVGYVAEVSQDFGGWVWPRLRGTWNGDIHIPLVNIIVDAIKVSAGNIATIPRQIAAAIFELDFTPAGEAIGYKLGTMSPTVLIAFGITFGQQLIQSIADGIRQVPPEVLAAPLIILWPLAVAAAGVVAAIAAVKLGAQFIYGIAKGFDEAHNNFFKQKVIDFPRGVIMLLAEAPTALVVRGIQLMAGLMRGFVDFFSSDFTPWVRGVPGQLIDFLEDAPTALFERGQDFVFGLDDGFRDVFQTIRDTMAEIRDIEIVNRFSGAIGWLYQAGKDIVQGLINGARALLGPLESLVNEIIGLWNRIPGQGDSPWPSMIAAGKDAMTGLIIGGESRLPELSGLIDRTISAFNNIPEMAATVTAEPGRAGSRMASAGGQTIVQNFEVTVNLEELEELAEAGRFVSQLNGTRTLYKGAFAAGGNI